MTRFEFQEGYPYQQASEEGYSGQQSQRYNINNKDENISSSLSHVKALHPRNCDRKENDETLNNE